MLLTQEVGCREPGLGADVVTVALSRARGYFSNGTLSSVPKTLDYPIPHLSLAQTPSSISSLLSRPWLFSVSLQPHALISSPLPAPGHSAPPP